MIRHGLEYLGALKVKNGPVFIVGMNGSGTTMLADCLGNHSDLYVLPMESKVLPYYLMQQDRFGNLNKLSARKKLANTLGRSKFYRQSNNKKNIVLRDEELDGSNFSSVVNALYLHLANQHGKFRWGDKSPINTQHIQALAIAFPDAQFVHIIRDGRDAAQSFHRRWSYDPLHTITRWKKVVNEGKRQGSTLKSDRYMELHYEALTAEPELLMRQICTFLEIEYQDSLLNSTMRYMDPSHGSVKTGRITSNSGKWSSYFTPKQVVEFESIAGEMLYSLGYPVSLRGNIDPHPLWLRYWLIRDGLGHTHWFLAKYDVSFIHCISIG